MVEGFPRIRSGQRPPDIACLEGVIGYWHHGSPSALSRWYAANQSLNAPAEIPSRMAWAHGLWFSTSSGTMATLRQHIRTGVPVVVLLQRSALNPDTRAYWVITGFDDTNRVVLGLKPDSPAQTMPYDEFERAWRVNRNLMTTAVPPDFDKRALEPRELYERARYFEAAGSYEKAAADYEAAADAGFGQTALYVRLGNTQRNRGLAREAEAAYRRAIAADPHNAQAYNNLAYLLAESGTRLDEAVHLARQALVLEPANPLVLDTLGFSLYQQGSYRDAADVLERARARGRWLPPSAQADIGIHLIRAHIGNENYHLGREVMRDVLRNAPGTKIPEDVRQRLE